MNSRSVARVLLTNSTMNLDRGHTPPRSAAKVIFLSWSFIVIRSLLNLDIYAFYFSSSLCLMVRRYAVRCLLLQISINCVRNRRATFPKPSMDPGAKDPNHTLASPLKVSEKALQATSSGKPCRVMWALKVSKCSRRSLVPSYMSIRGTRNFGGRGTAITSLR